MFVPQKTKMIKTDQCPASRLKNYNYLNLFYAIRDRIAVFVSLVISFVSQRIQK